MKTIIGRFQEMKKNPMETLSLDGEEASLNKVDSALASVGISLKDANGQFRDLDDVIFELADIWDTLDRNTQRWIANTVSGSRQQSRFLALMSDSERLTELYNAALESEDAALIQYSKTLESIDTKVNRLSTSFQQFYMGIINGPVIGKFLDIVQSLVDKFNEVGPLASAAIVASVVQALTYLGKIAAVQIATTYKEIESYMGSRGSQINAIHLNLGRNAGKAFAQGFTNEAQKGYEGLGLIENNPLQPSQPELHRRPGYNKRQFKKDPFGTSSKWLKDHRQIVSSIGSIIGLTATASNAMVDLSTASGRATSGAIHGLSVMAGTARLVAGDTFGGIMQIVSSGIQGISSLIYTAEEQYNDLKKRIETTNLDRATSKQDLKNLEDYKKKYDELSNKINKTAAEEEEYQSLKSEMIEKYPQLFGYMSNESMQIGFLKDEYDKLYNSLKRVAIEKQLIYEQTQLDLANNPRSYMEQVGYVEKDGPFKDGTYSGIIDALSHTDPEAENLREAFLQQLRLYDSSERDTYESLVAYLDGNEKEKAKAKKRLQSEGYSDDDLTMLETVSSPGFIEQYFENKTAQNRVIKTNRAKTVVEQDLRAKFGTEDVSSFIIDDIISKISPEKIEQLSNDLSSITAEDIFKLAFGDDFNTQVEGYKKNNITYQSKSSKDRKAIDSFTENPYAYTQTEATKFLDTTGKGVFSEEYRTQLLNELEQQDREFVAEVSKKDDFFNDEILVNMPKILRQKFLDDLDAAYQENSLVPAEFIKDLSELFPNLSNEPEIQNILQQADVSSITGIVDLINTLRSVDEQAAKSVQDLFFTPDGQVNSQIKTTQADFNEALKNYRDVSDRAVKLWKDNFGSEEIFDLIDNYGFSITDFDDNGAFVGTFDQFIQKIIGNAEMILTAIADSGDFDGEEDIEFYNKIIQKERNKIIENETKKILNAIISGFDSETGKIIIDQEIFSELQKRIGSGLGNLFTISDQGYTFSGTNEQLKGLIEQLPADIANTPLGYAMQDLIDNYNGLSLQITQTVDNSAEKLAQLREDAVETSISIDDVQMLIDNYGYSISDFAADADGGFVLLNKDGLIAEKTIESIDKKIEELSNAEEQTDGLKERIKLLKQQKAILQQTELEHQMDFMGDSEVTDSTFKYLSKFVSGVSEYQSSLEDMVENSRISYFELDKILNNIGWDSALSHALGLLEEGENDIILAQKRFAEQFGKSLEIDAGEPFIKLSQDQVAAIQQGSEDSLEAIARGRIAQIDATIAMLESMQSLEQADITTMEGMEFEAGVSVIGPNGKTFQNKAEFVKWAIETITAAEGKSGFEALTVTAGVDFEVDENGQITNLEEAISGFYDALIQPEYVEKLGTKIVTPIKQEANAIVDAVTRAQESINSLDRASLETEMVELYGSNGNVDLTSRKSVKGQKMKDSGWSDFDGDYATLYSQTVSAGHGDYAEIEFDQDVVVNLTPITATGEVLTPESFKDYVKKLFEKATNIDEVLANDDQGLIINYKLVDEGQSFNSVISQNDKEMEALHLYQAALYPDPEKAVEEAVLQATAQVEAANEVVKNNPLEPQLDTKPAEEQFKNFTEHIESTTIIPKVFLDLSAVRAAWFMVKNEISAGITTSIHTVASGSSSTNTFKKTAGNFLSKIKKVAFGNGGVATTGKALVGELGPEIRVSDNKYTIVGENGAEFVDLKKGDIIIDAENTNKLIKHQEGARGSAFANGTGNAYGSGIDNAIAQLQKEKAGLLAALKSLPDLLGKAAGGRHGGGGSGSDKVDKEYLMELERWFNWLRQIEQLENKITVLRSKRENLKDGKNYADSLYEENALLFKQNVITKDLLDNQIAFRDSLKADYLKNYGKYFYFVGDALQINAEAILADTKNNEELGEAIQDMIDEYDEITGQITDNTSALEENKKQMDENIRGLRDKYIEMENEVLEALKNSYEKQIELKQKELDKRIESDEKYLTALRRNLDKERQMRDQNSQFEEREKLQKKLSLLERDTSGKSDKEIAALRQQLHAMQEQTYYEEREKDIQEIENAAKLQQDFYQQEIDNLTEANEIKLENMQLYWAEVENIISQGSTAVLSFLQTYGQDYNEMSKVQQEDFTNNWKFTIDAALQYAQDMQKKFDEIIAHMQDQKITGDLNATGGLDRPSETNHPSYGGGSSSSGSSSYHPRPRPTPSKKPSSFLDKIHDVMNGGADKIHGIIDKATDFIDKHSHSSSSKLPSRRPLPPRGGQNVIFKKYARGGLADYTGFAIVHGTERKPEAFLNARDTALMRDFLDEAKKMNLGNFIVPRTTQINRPNDFVKIDNVAINIESGVVETPTQADQLSRSISNELLHIARQSGNISVSRR